MHNKEGCPSVKFASILASIVKQGPYFQRGAISLLEDPTITWEVNKVGGIYNALPTSVHTELPILREAQFY